MPVIEQSVYACSCRAIHAYLLTCTSLIHGHGNFQSRCLCMRMTMSMCVSVRRIT